MDKNFKKGNQCTQLKHFVMSIHTQNTISHLISFSPSFSFSKFSVDNDDGSSFYYTHDNVLISASAGAAYGGNSLKSGELSI